jgi:hypothetical protein
VGQAARQHLHRGLIAVLACSQAACAFDPGASSGLTGGADGGSTTDGPAAAVPSPDGSSAAGCPDDADLLACLSFDGDAVDDSSYHIPVALGGAPSFAAGVAGQARGSMSRSRRA